MTEKQVADFLERFIPLAATPYLAGYMVRQPLSLKVSRSRRTKYGDYRAPYGNNGHRISVNADLNPFAFLLTLVHELAHYSVFIKYENRVKPHGDEWKKEFRILMQPLLNLDVFPHDILQQLKIYMTNPKASTCSDPRLLTVLNKYNKTPATYLSDIEYGKPFAFRGRVYKRMAKRRTRYECLQLPENRAVLISGIAEVQKIDM